MAHCLLISEIIAVLAELQCTGCRFLQGRQFHSTSAIVYVLIGSQDMPPPPGEVLELEALPLEQPAFIAPCSGAYNFQPRSGQDNLVALKREKHTKSCHWWCYAAATHIPIVFPWYPLRAGLYLVGHTVSSFLSCLCAVHVQCPYVPSSSRVLAAGCNTCEYGQYI